MNPNTPTLTPGARVLRTILQVVVAVGAAVPAAAALLPGGAARYAGALGILGAIVVLVTAVQNALESAAGATLLARPSAPPTSTPAAGELEEPADHE